MIVKKMPAKSFATSTIGAHENALLARTSRGVSASEATASAASAPSRTTFCSASGVPSTSKTIPGSQSPDSRTAPTTPAMSAKFCAPSIASGS